MTTEEALEIAEKYDLKKEVQELIDIGLTPEEALLDWAIIPEEHTQ